MIFHKPVLIDEVIEGLKIRSGGKYIDATLGGGGHTKEIVNRGGIVFGIDRDEDALEYAKNALKRDILQKKAVFMLGNFANIGELAQKARFGQVDGILFDLGISSYQIDQAGRGISFSKEEPLDMRMDKTSNLTAYEIVNNWGEEELYEIFAKYGEEIKAREVARIIVDLRRSKPIATSLELAKIVKEVIRHSSSNILGKEIHPATKIFQALRIATNDEINNLKKGLEASLPLIAGSGRLVLISFHSLEDRIVKLYFLKLERGGVGKIITKKPILPTQNEIRQNRRARSAKLRIFEKYE